MSDVVQKWGKSVAERGFVQIPTYLLNINRFLGEEYRLTPVELLVVFQLVGNWWKKEEDPFPAIATLASRCGVSTRQVQRAINRLDEMNLIKRSKRKRGKLAVSNSYSLAPLVSLLDEVSKAFPNEYPRKVTKEDRNNLEKNFSNFIEKNDQKRKKEGKLHKELNSSVAINNINEMNSFEIDAEENTEYYRNLAGDMLIKYNAFIENVNAFVGNFDMEDSEKEELKNKLINLSSHKAEIRKNLIDAINAKVKENIYEEKIRDDIHTIYDEIEKYQENMKEIKSIINNSKKNK